MLCFIFVNGDSGKNNAESKIKWLLWFWYNYGFNKWKQTHCTFSSRYLSQVCISKNPFK